MEKPGPKTPVAVVPGYLEASPQQRAEIDETLAKAAADKKAGRGGIRAEFEVWKKERGYS